MIRRLYVHNFRCLQNFELKLEGQSSALLVGKNGTGKTTVAAALIVLQQIARGVNLVGELVKPKDITAHRPNEIVRIEIEARIAEKIYAYNVAFEFPNGADGLVVRDEKLTAGSMTVYWREAGQIVLKMGPNLEFRMPVRPNLVALPILQDGTNDDPVQVFRQWLANIAILRPIPALIHGDSTGGTLLPNQSVDNLGAWWAGTIAHAPSAYAVIDRYLKQLFPDLLDIRNPSITRDSRNLEISFTREQTRLLVGFEDLSDGEKCMIISALVLAANESYGPLVCFWDEPDNFLALSEISHFIVALRKAFSERGQFICTSHSAEVLRTFSRENTYVLHRKSHLDPVLLRPLSEIDVPGDRGDAMARGDLEPWD